MESSNPFIFNSSLPKSLVKTAIGVNSTKNKKASTIGLTILPKIYPRNIHALLKGESKFGRKKVVIIVTKNKERKKNDKLESSLIKKYKAQTKKTKEKKRPNFRFVGNNGFSIGLVHSKN